jgi:hypothetical protein
VIGGQGLTTDTKTPRKKINRGLTDEQESRTGGDGTGGGKTH